MSPLIYGSLVIFSICFLGITAVFLAYPLLVLMVAPFCGRKNTSLTKELPPVTVIVAVRNAAKLIDAKLTNCFELTYPSDKLEFIFTSDASEDDTEFRIRAVEDKRVLLLRQDEHLGKASALNMAVAEAKGEIIVMTDGDAILVPDAIQKLVRHFGDDQVGGICGQRLICKENSNLKDAQQGYIKFDSSIKLLESKMGRISSNDGKIYCFRRALATPVHGACTDDFYSSMSIIEQGYKFLFEPEAIAYIRLPSRNPRHELSRRRRVVCRSLSGISIKRKLLNPFRYGFFSLSLLINKIVRRLLPLFLVFLFLSTAALSFLLYAPWNYAFMGFLAAQTAFYLLALSHFLIGNLNGFKLPRKLASTAFYCCLGMLGTFLGALDFLSGKRVVKWNPVKGDTRG